MSDWELDYHSRPVLDADGKKRWELLLCSTPEPPAGDASLFRWSRSCPAGNVNSAWLREALAEAIVQAEQQGHPRPRRLRSWRPAMRTMVQRAADSLGLQLIPSRRCYTLISWLQQRELEVYPLEAGHIRGPLAPAPTPVRPQPRPLPETARGHSWTWARLDAAQLQQADAWEADFSGLFPLPPTLNRDASIPGVVLFGGERALAIAAWLAGLEPVRLEICERQLVVEAGLEERWLLSELDGDTASTAAAELAAGLQQSEGIQFLAVQSSAQAQRFTGFWMLRSLQGC